MTDPLRVAVLDDDAPSRERVRALLDGREGYRLVAELDDPTKAAAAIRATRPHLLLMDIGMPEVGGLELLSHLDEPRPHVILMTGHEEYALPGYDLDAVDFLLKPYARDRFDRAIQRGADRVRKGELLRMVERLRTALSAADSDRPSCPPRGRRGGSPPLQRLVVSSQGRKRLVDTGDIRWIEAANYYARLHTDDRSHLLRRSLTWLEGHLDPTRFVRIHRSSIVSIDHLSEVIPQANGGHVVALDDGTELRLASTRKARLERLLGQSL